MDVSDREQAANEHYQRAGHDEDVAQRERPHDALTRRTLRPGLLVLLKLALLVLVLLIRILLELGLAVLRLSPAVLRPIVLALLVLGPSVRAALGIRISALIRSSWIVGARLMG
ncbi:hypothetical protein GCM10027344_05710 [Spelaeicoccus albus]